MKDDVKVLNYALHDFHVGMQFSDCWEISFDAPVLLSGSVPENLKEVLVELRATCMK